MTRLLFALLLACCCGPCCPCDDCPCEGAEVASCRPLACESCGQKVFGATCPCEGQGLPLVASYSAPVAVQFDWSPPASHHAAVVAVQAGNRGGSGVYVQCEGVFMVLTCEHVAVGGSTMTAKFLDGTVRTGQPRTDKFGHDVAGMLVEKHPTVEPIQFAPTIPTPTKVEMLGYAGPAGKLRHWWGSVARDSSVSVTKYDAGVGSGDSGGPVLNEQGQLIGLLAHGEQPNNTDGWATYNRAGGPAWTPLRNFAIRLRAFSNPSGQNPPLNERPAQGCPGGICPPRGGGGGYGGGGLYPPSPDQYPPQPTPAAPGCQCPDYSARLDAIDGKIASLELLSAKPAPSAEQIADAIFAKYGERLRGPKGDKGDPGSDGASPAPNDGITHAVLVVDRSATYWPRLSTQLERARQRYNGIRIAPPPEFATQLPAIVFYENGKPVLVRKGERDVTHTLTAIERGDLSFLQES